MAAAPDYVLEESWESGRTLVVTGRWRPEAAEVLMRGEADGLVLNYARGFREGTLDFLNPGWGLRRLNLLDRRVADLEPITRLAGSLEALSVQAHPDAELDLGGLPKLKSVAGAWALIGPTLGGIADLRSVITWQFGETDLQAFRAHFALKRLTIKDAPYLESLSGVGALPELEVLGIFLAQRLADITAAGELASSLRDLELEACSSIGAIDDVESAVNLRFLGVGDCGDIESFTPIGALTQLETLHAWGSTRVDGDLSPLTQLRHLREIRMRDRREYSPRVADIVAALST